MSLDNLLFSALSAIPEVARTGPIAIAVHPVVFPQPAQRYNPPWPAIRYSFISAVPVEDICGDGEDDSEDVRVQLDIVALTRTEVRAIRLQVRSIMSTFSPPAILEDEADDYDGNTKTFRWRMDYIVQPSSYAGSPSFP